MRVLLLDTNVVSILFKPEHALYQRCFSGVGMAESRVAGRPVAASDAWIAAAARQWDLALATTDYQDFEHLNRLTLIPISR